MRVQKPKDTNTPNTKQCSGMIASAHIASQWPKPAYQIQFLKSNKAIRALLFLSSLTLNSIVYIFSQGPGDSSCHNLFHSLSRRVLEAMEVLVFCNKFVQEFVLSNALSVFIALLDGAAYFVPPLMLKALDVTVVHIVPRDRHLTQSYRHIQKGR